MIDAVSNVIVLPRRTGQVGLAGLRGERQKRRRPRRLCGDVGGGTSPPRPWCPDMREARPSLPMAVARWACRGGSLIAGCADTIVFVEPLCWIGCQGSALGRLGLCMLDLEVRDQTIARLGAADFATTLGVQGGVPDPRGCQDFKTTRLLYNVVSEVKSGATRRVYLSNNEQYPNVGSRRAWLLCLLRLDFLP